MRNLTLGSDPEFFLLNNVGKVVSSHTAGVQGDKKHPHALEYGAMHRDNVLVEINVPPAHTVDEWVSSHVRTMKLAESEISDEYKIAKDVSVHMDMDELWHPEAATFGCEPDYCAYTREKNPAPNSYTDLRSAGGHVHFGYETEQQDMDVRIVLAADLFLAVPALLMDHDDERRSLYGKAGAYRPKPYGVEYRTLSNFWIHSEALMSWCFRNAERAYDFACHATDEQFAAISVARTAINTPDRELAAALVGQYNLEAL